MENEDFKFKHIGKPPWIASLCWMGILAFCFL